MQQLASNPRPMNFLRWFGGLSFLIVGLGALGTAATLSHFLAAEILQWDAGVTAEFVANVAETQSAYGGFPRKTAVAEILGGTATAADFQVSRSVADASLAEFRDHVRALPGAVGIKLYALDRSVAWFHRRDGYDFSSADDRREYEYRERTFRLPIESSYGALGRWDAHPSEAQWEMGAVCCVENYIPLYDSSNRVVGVVEIHKEPSGLRAIMQRGRILVWISLLIFGALLFVTLFWLARRATMVMEDQQRRLVDSETLTVIGEMSLAVAHGIRNPLAAIRSSAELTLDHVHEEPRKHMMDIIAQADRLSYWLRDLLQYARPAEVGAEAVSVTDVLREALDGCARRLSQASIDLDWIEPEAHIPPVQGNRPLLLQSFTSILSNAAEGMAGGGALKVRCYFERTRGHVCVTVADTGHGMSEEQLAHAFRPFNTSKAQGLGVGLWLVKRTIERCGGRVHIQSRVGEGTKVEIVIPIAR
jgi:two-component system sensor histidine kinase HydH